MSIICFESTLLKIGTWIILRLPENASAKLPSRGMTMVEGTINGFSFLTALEPDGMGSHWFKVDKRLSEALEVEAGDTVILEIEPAKKWTEPNVPDDLKNAVEANPEMHKLWMGITPNARWDWLRWIRSTKNPQTRQKRIEVACSKLKAGDRRPCCFNRNLCTETYVSKNGVLIDCS